MPILDASWTAANARLPQLDAAARGRGRFLIDKLENLVWNDKAFNSLVLPGGEKELVWEFVDGKARPQDAVGDFVPEKA
ncbi:1e7ecb10-5c14-40be-b30a-275429f10f28 [Thermothielavioides terrestris]|uniref:1e7ecb10-5c14-40be-b30a-275429f10f28 n=1 Tax=Thermothielavioides terrestris TaxID=2587410 RepID=A0A3S4AQ12_9PEZI|nr:1e7ecb10-5c14-40be-b30a-275429f10f28 [Thermothielavioides terrestris]